MGISFVETMAGSVNEPKGERGISFTVQAASDTAFAIWGFAPLALSGTIAIEGTDGVHAVQPDSSLEIGLPLHRELRYRLNFTDADGHQWRFYGQKDVRLWNLPGTMTTLRGMLFRDGEEVGRTTVRFRLRDMARFLGTWRPWTPPALPSPA